MKIVNEKGKLFGIINLVDLACLLIILLVLVGVGWKLLGTKVQEAVAPQATMVTTFRIRGAYDYMLKELENTELVGEQLIMGTGYIDGAYVTGLSYEPFVRQEVTYDGSIVDSVDPTRQDVLLTVESPIAANAVILKIGNQEVRAGRTFIFKTRFFETSVQIDAVTLK